MNFAWTVHLTVPDPDPMYPLNNERVDLIAVDVEDALRQAKVGWPTGTVTMILRGSPIHLRSDE